MKAPSKPTGNSETKILAESAWPPDNSLRTIAKPKSFDSKKSAISEDLRLDRRNSPSFPAAFRTCSKIVCPPTLNSGLGVLYPFDVNLDPSPLAKKSAEPTAAIGSESLPNPESTASCLLQNSYSAKSCGVPHCMKWLISYTRTFLLSLAIKSNAELT